ncbi:hypothetical protein BDF14DRAFT_425669 [Spinellus fusiger]|nr:hypothetical protein BDF14DRAFT_425669 [Spinellus fusiger]
MSSEDIYFDKRKARFLNMADEEELPFIRNGEESPYTPEEPQKEAPMSSTPTTQRVYQSYKEDLRKNKRPKHTEFDHFDYAMEPKTSLTAGGDTEPLMSTGGAGQDPLQRGSMSVESSRTHVTRSSLFSEPPSLYPKPFHLYLFDTCFREPPGSTQLTRIYGVFSSRPGQKITSRNVLEIVEDGSHLYTLESVRLILQQLYRKRFVQRVNDGWTLRH